MLKFPHYLLNPDYSLAASALDKTRDCLKGDLLDRWFVSRGVGAVVVPIALLIEAIREVIFSGQAFAQTFTVTKAVKDHLWKATMRGSGAIMAPACGLLSPSHLLLPGMVKLGIQVDGIAASSFSKWKALAGIILGGTAFAQYSVGLLPIAHQVIRVVGKQGPNPIFSHPLAPRIGVGLFVVVYILAFRYSSTKPPVDPPQRFDLRLLKRAYAAHDLVASNGQITLLLTRWDGYFSSYKKEVLQTIVQSGDVETVTKILQHEREERPDNFIPLAIAALAVALRLPDAVKGKMKQVGFDALVSDFNGYRETTVPFWIRPMMEAIQQGECEVVRLFLDRGAEVDIQNVRGITPLMVAAQLGIKSIYLLLIERGANIHYTRRSTENDGFHRAPKSVFGHALNWDKATDPDQKADKTWIINDLITRGVDPDAEADDGGVTHLMYAAYHDPRIVSPLLMAGADWSIQDSQGIRAHRYWSGANYSPFRDKRSTDLDPAWKSLRQCKILLRGDVRRDSPFPKQIPLDHLPANVELQLSGGEVRGINAALWMNAFSFFKTLWETDSESFKSGQPLPLDMDVNTFQAITTYLAREEVAFFEEDPLAQMKKMQRTLEGYAKFQFPSAVSSVEKQLIEKIPLLKDKTVEDLEKWAERLHCADLIWACQKRLQKPLTAPPLFMNIGSSAKTYPRGFYALWDPTERRPITLARDDEEQSIHRVVLANAGLKGSAFHDRIRGASRETVQHFLQLLYTGQLEPHIDEQELFRLASLGQTLEISDPFRERLNLAYLNSVMKHALLGNGQLSSTQRQQLAQVTGHPIVNN